MVPLPFYIVLLPLKFSLKFAFASFSQTSKILLTSLLPQPCQGPVLAFLFTNQTWNLVLFGKMKVIGIDFIGTRYFVSQWGRNDRFHCKEGGQAEKFGFYQYLVNISC